MNAGAGSGKTYQLAYKYIRDAVNDPMLYRRILAVTFTNKATEEMKTRILNELYALSTGGAEHYMQRLESELGVDPQTIRTKADEVLKRILHDYSHFTVLTIDKFFQRIMRAFIRELGIDLDYNIELETDTILSKSTDTLIENITADAELRDWITAFARENIESGEQWDIRKGILAMGGEIFKENNKLALESAPSKRDIKRMVDDITARADNECNKLFAMGRRAMDIMARAGVGPSDFAGKGNSFAFCFAELADGKFKKPTPTARKRALSPEGWCRKDSPAAAAAIVGELQPLLAEICELYDNAERTVTSADMLRSKFRSFGVLADLYAKVREVCEQENSMILSETKYMLSQLIADNDAPFIYEKVGNRFERLMIDEFQDTSSKEWSNFLPLLRNAVAQSDDTSVFIVGDIKQSIYRWRGGDWRILAEQARADLKAENTEVETLKNNFRSLQRIVEFNNDIIHRVVWQDNEALDGNITEAVESGMLGAAAAAELRGTLLRAYKDHEQTPCRKDSREGYVRIETFDKDAEPPVTEYIESALARGYKPSDIMILVRGNSEGVEIAEMLLQYKSTHPECRFDIMTQQALIVGRSAAVCFIIAAMKLAVDPSDTVSLAVYNNYRRRAVDTQPDDELSAFFRSIRLLSPEEAFERILMHERMQNDSEAVAYIQALHEQILGYCSGRVADIPLFLKWWDEQGCIKSLSVEQSESTIEIMTIHKAKGLEKPVIIIPYCNWSTEPLPGGTVWAAAAADEQIAEIGSFPMRYGGMGHSFFSEGYYREKIYSHVDNINLLYVALTRAGEELYAAIPQSSRTSKNHIGELVLGALSAGDRYVRTDLNDGYVRYEYGSQATAAPSRKKQQATACKLTNYPASDVSLHLRLPSQRYFEDEASEAELSPRDLGILMHRAFEQAATRSDIFDSVERMRTDGVLNGDDAHQLQEMITQALSDSVIGEWFSDSWDEVRTEADIVMPHNGSEHQTTRRPDRVMIRGERAVVVDYKFGTKAAAAYRRQIGDYMRLLREMGYANTEGYIWYVRLGNVEKVPAE